MKTYIIILIGLVLIYSGCKSKGKQEPVNADNKFTLFEERFLDAYWKQYPAASINIGYGKYYDQLVVPDSNSIQNNVKFSGLWLDSLKMNDFNKLSDNNKISFNIIKNQLESDTWYLTVFKQYQWDATSYNISGSCYYIIHQPYAPLEDRLRILSRFLENADKYYKAAFSILKEPTKEHALLSLNQNQGGLSIFGQDLTDSIKISKLTDAEKVTLNTNVSKAVDAIKGFATSLKGILADKNYTFRSFRIGKELFKEKFKYDIAADFSPEEIYTKSISDKKYYYNDMFKISNELWSKYYKNQSKPKDTLQLIQAVISKIALQHAKPEDFFDTLTNQVKQMKSFIIKKDLFDFDTTYPIIVRIMPAYESGFSIASAEFTPPYQKHGETYYNIDDLTKYPKDKAESSLREYNNYGSQLLSIHEAMPGHCLQGIYNNKKSSDVLRSVFQNGTMIEGWAVYVEGMMLENGWGDQSPEMQLIFDKLKLRELANVIIDYDIQCLNKPKESIMHLLVNECFQTQAQAEEKYHRATVSQVQLCSYYSGFTAIQSLRDEYKKKKGDKYTLKDFHEKFLSYGSSPVKYIRERMLSDN